MIAALFVKTDGCYYGLPGVDPWDEQRDARLYDGPWPIVSHSPCQRWGKLWAGQPLYIKQTGIRKIKGDDGGMTSLWTLFDDGIWAITLCRPSGRALRSRSETAAAIARRGL